MINYQPKKKLKLKLPIEIQIKENIISMSICRSILHGGSLALGSAITAVCKIIKFILYAITVYLKNIYIFFTYKAKDK